jgi:hypothetical protein
MDQGANMPFEDAFSQRILEPSAQFAAAWAAQAR